MDLGLYPTSSSQEEPRNVVRTLVQQLIGSKRGCGMF